MANTEGVNVVISGDNSKLLRSVEESKTALAGMLSFNIGDKLSQGFGSILSSLAGVLQRVAGAVSSTMKSALAIGGGFEAQITNVKVISGATEQELDMLIKKAREMGATLPITAKDAATAMTLLAQRGTSAKDILASVADVANLTISQGIDMGTAADLLGSTMTNFGIEIDNAARVTAIFNNACNQSALSMPKLVEAMKYVGPAAGAVGMELTEAVSAMEAIANAGLTGEMTGTGMAMVMSKLAATTHIMGVRTKELDGSMRPLKDIFTELKNEGFSLSDAITAFGQRGSKAALALAKNSESLAVNEERLKNWSSTQTAVNEKAKTFTNTMAALRSAVEELHIEIFEQIKNQSKEAVGGVAELTRSFSKWVGETQIAGKSLNAFIEGLGFKIPSGTGFEALLKQFNVQAFVDKVKNFGATLKSIGESIVGFFDKIKTPLTWLINNLDKFALVSFWGWILGKGLQIPVAIMSIATAFLQLYSALHKLTTLSLAGLTTLLASPAGLIGVGVAGSIGVAAYAANKISAANAELKKAIEEEKRYLAEQAKADVQLPIDIQFDIKTGFEKLPESWTKASDEVRAKADADIKEIRDKFRNNVSEAVLAVMAKFPEMADSFTGLAGAANLAGKKLTETELAIQALTNADLTAEQAGTSLDVVMAKLAVTSEIMGVKTKELDGSMRPLEKIFTELKDKGFSLSDAIEAFGMRGGKAVSALAKSFSDAAGKIGTISDDMLRKMSDALHGDEEAFKALPEPIQRVTEQVNAMRIAAGEGGAELIGMFAKYRQVRQELGKPLKKPETQSFFEELASGVYGITTSLTGEIERAKTFLNGSDGQLAVNVSVTQAQKKLEQFVKTVADKYAIPEDIVKASVIDKLGILAAKGNDVAESLANGFSGAGSNLEMFLTNAQEAINYLGASPDKFMPALNQMMTGIQRIDPLTGKLTEKFKKAHDALKQWANISFDQLTSRVQKLRRAVEGGFIDKSALEAELKRVMPQLKLQVVNELQPQREQYRSERDYQAVVASELISRLNDMFGEVGMNMARDMFNGKTGVDMGRAIVAEVERGFSGSSGTFKLNGIDQLQQSISSLPQNISNAMQPCISKLEQLNSSQNSKQSLPTVRDYSSVLASIIKEIQTSSNANVSAVNNVVTAVNAVKTVVETQNKNTTVVVDQNGIAQAVTTGVNPLLGALQAISANLESVQNTVQAGVTAVNAVENAVKSQEMTVDIDESKISNAVDPLTSVVQNLSTVLNTIQALHQANSNAINDVLTAVSSLETAIKAMNSGNTFDIDINQEGFTIEKKSDSDVLARATANAFRAGIGNGGL